jgi:primosomal protein N' (replication factor Y)
VLVPEIALTPRTVDRFRAAGNKVAVLHSALSDGERLDAWRAIRSGDRPIVVGARAVLLRCPTWSDHCRRGARGELRRARRPPPCPRRGRHARQCRRRIVILGSATPSLESWANAQRDAYRLLTLPEPSAGRLAARAGVDMRVKSPTIVVDPFRRVFSEPLDRALRDTIAKREQAILLLNRRGFAAFVQCGACGDVADCPNCSISLTVHRTPERLTCHYCGYAEAIRVSCARAWGPTVKERGLGTQQVERLLLDHLPRCASPGWTSTPRLR